jgi:hypothetical protein
MKALQAFETFIIIYQVMQHNITEDLNLQVETYLSKHPTDCEDEETHFPEEFEVIYSCLFPSMATADVLNDTPQSILLNTTQIKRFIYG